MTPGGPTDAVSDVIRDAACLVLVDRSETAPRLLMGRRHADQIFLPNKWVFPGGRVDAGDHTTRGLPAIFGLPQWLDPYARAAIRELNEETGLAFDPASDASLWPLARAITPPGRVRRYDTWFFMAEFNAAHGAPLGGDGELLDLAWLPVDAARRLDVPNVTRLVLDDAVSQLAHDAAPPRDRTPFYVSVDHRFERRMIDCRPSAPPP